MKVFSIFGNNTESNLQSEGSEEQTIYDKGQILFLAIQHGFLEVVLLFFFLLVCEILSLVCPPKIFFENLHIDIQYFI